MFDSEGIQTKLGIIIVDHGSRRAESNDLLLEVVEQFRQESSYSIIEPAHMELAEPSIADAFAKCVQQGATQIIVHPYFLSPGRHWHEDIPRLAAEASEQHGNVPWNITRPLGPHPLMLQIIQDRIETTLRDDQP